MDADQLKTMRLFLMLAALLLVAAPAAAQSDDRITFETPVSGSIDAGQTARWSFQARSGAVMSFLAQAQDESLDPVLTLRDSGGRVVLANDDYAYPDSRDALLEAIAFPRTDTYTVEIAGFEDSAGAFTLTMLPGFATTGQSDSFDSTEDWSAADESVTLTPGEGMLTLSVEGVRQAGSASEPSGEVWGDFYAQVDVSGARGSGGWSAGLLARRQGDDYYAFVVNDDGLWRFTVMADGQERVLRDWISHPSIVAGQNEFTLGLMAKGAGFDFFYDGTFIGSVADTTLTDGSLELVVVSAPAPGSTASASFDNLIITTPFEHNGAPVLPQQVQVSDAIGMAQMLQRRHVVKAEGSMALTVPESFVQYARPGINRLMLGRGATYTNFALGATLNLQATTSGMAGCGLVFRYQSETDYTLAFLDQTGGYGISTREGDNFAPGLYGENPAWGPGEHHLLVIADQNTLYYYINGQSVGVVENPGREGQIGTAAVNFETIDTSCRFTNLWLWRWD